MNNKGQMNLALVLSIFIGIIVGLVLLVGTYPYIGDATNSQTITNGQITTPAAAATIDITGQDLLSTPVVTTPAGVVISDGNYTIAEAVSETSGVKRIQYTTIGTEYDATLVNVTYTYGPEGYIESAGGRSVAGLIAIFGALAIAILSLVPILKSKGVFGS